MDDKITKQIEEEFRAMSENKQVMIDTIAERAAPALVRQERQKGLKPEEIKADEMVQAILKMVESIMRMLGFTTQLSGEKVSPAQMEKIKETVKKSIDSAEVNEAKNSSIEIKKSSEKSSEKNKRITAEDVLKNRASLGEFKMQANEKRQQQQQQQQQGKSMGRGR